MNRRLLAMVALVFCAGVACDIDAVAGPAVEGSFEKTLTVSGPVELDVKTGAGNIQARSGPAGSVQVRARIHARGGILGGGDPDEKVRRIEKDPPIEQNGNLIRIGHIRDHELGRNVSISYELVVPAESRMRSATGSGNHSIDGVRGGVNAATGSGNITMANIAGETRAVAGSGNIRLDPVEGGMHVTTGSGNIRLQQTAEGEVEVRTGSGNVEVGGLRGGLRVRSGSGNVSVDGEPKARWSVDVGSGRLSLRLPPQAAFDLYARTGSGRVSVDHPLTAEGTPDKDRREREVRGKVRGGGASVDLRTGSGDIQVR